MYILVLTIQCNNLSTIISSNADKQSIFLTRLSCNILLKGVIASFSEWSNLSSCSTAATTQNNVEFRPSSDQRMEGRRGEGEGEEVEEEEGTKGYKCEFATPSKQRAAKQHLICI